MIIRYPMALSFALATTFGLFWIMQALVYIEWVPVPTVATPSIDFVRVKLDPVVPETPPKPERPTKPEPPPVVPRPTTTRVPGPDAAVIPTEPAPGPIVGPTISTGVDRAAVPRIRFDPRYPIRARQAGIEGWATVEFSITTLGSVVNPRVVASHPARVFDRSSIQAVQRWKYDPRVEDGKAVPQHGVRVTLDYTLER